MSSPHESMMTSSQEIPEPIIGIPFSPHEVVIGETSPVPIEIHDVPEHLNAEEKILAISGLHARYKYDRQLAFAEQEEEKNVLIERVVAGDKTIVGLGTDLAKSERRAKRYKMASERGQFGNLYNKRTFNKLGKRIIDHDQRAKSDYPKIATFSDIDELHILNGLVGETVIDTEVLDPTAKIMGRKTRNGSIITGQMGGDEYAQIIQGMSLEEAVDQLMRQQRAVNAITINKSFVGADSIDRIGLTVAYAVVQPGESYKDVMRRAVRAKKYAKEVVGRNSVVNADDVPEDWVYVRKARAS